MRKLWSDPIKEMNEYNPPWGSRITSLQTIQML